MKKIILITTIILAISTSFTAKAQYAYPPQAQEQEHIAQQKISLFEMAEYKDAKVKERKGKSLFFSGLGAQLGGAAIMGLTTLVAYERIETDSYYSQGWYWNDADSVLFVVGGLSAIAGSVMEVIGLCKWIDASSTIKDLRINYAIGGGGIVVTF